MEVPNTPTISQSQIIMGLLIVALICSTVFFATRSHDADVDTTEGVYSIDQVYDKGLNDGYKMGMNLYAPALAEAMGEDIQDPNLGVVFKYEPQE